MPKILTDAQFVTMSTPSTPPTGYGSVFASGSSLFFRNATGTTFDLAAAGGGGYTIIREYTASATWTKPAGMYELLIVCVGAGGGGGSGRVAPPSVPRLGGTGGGGGAVSWIRHAASALPSQCDITVGAGGITGSASGPAQQSGSNGGNGTATTFTSGSGAATRTFASATGGGGGNGGAAGAAAGGFGGSAVGVSGPVSRGPWNLTGGDGGPTTAVINGNPPANNALNGSFGAGGGGAAGGINASNLLQVGGSGSSVSYYGVFTGAVAGGIASLGSNGTNGNDNIGKSLLMISGSDTVFGIGSGGGGGGPGGNGGNGGNYGAGGGGGGANTTGSLSGAGGRGGNGLCILVEYY